MGGGTVESPDDSRQRHLAGHCSVPPRALWRYLLPIAGRNASRLGNRATAQVFNPRRRPDLLRWRPRGRRWRLRSMLRLLLRLAAAAAAPTAAASTASRRMAIVTTAVHAATVVLRWTARPFTLLHRSGTSAAAATPTAALPSVTTQRLEPTRPLSSELALITAALVTSPARL